MPLKSMKDAWPSQAAHARSQSLTKGPVSGAERDTLVQSRATPKMEMHLTPGGTIQHSVNRKVEADREARIGFIQKRLAQQQSRARDGFNRNR